MPRHRWVPPVLACALAASLSLVVPPLLAAAPPTCAGETATLVGTDGPDRLSGTPRRDVVVGLAGDDVIDGLAGPDLLCGGPGADRLLGGSGDDELLGGTDRLAQGPGGSYLLGDTLLGGPGDDSMVGGADTRAADQRRRPDTYSFADATGGVTVDLSGVPGVAAGEGQDEIRVGAASGVTGTAYADTLVGSDGPDVLDGRGGPDTLSAGPGADTVWPDGLEAADGRDVVETGPGADLVSSLAGRDVVATGGGADFVEAFSPEPTAVDAGPGADYVAQLVTPGQGAATAAGPGDDVVTLYGRLLAGQSPAARLTVDHRTGTTSVSGAVTATGTVAGVERLRLVGPLRWRFLGSDRAERVWAVEGGPLRAITGGGDDQVTGSPRDDLLDGQAGTDAGYRGGGDDTCRRIERGDC